MIDILIIGTFLILLVGLLALAVKKSNDASLPKKEDDGDIKSELKKLRVLAGLSTGQGIISRQPFMDLYNNLDITTERIEALKTEILSTYKFNEKRKIEKEIIANLNDNLKINEDYIDIDKTGYGSMYYKFFKESMAGKSEKIPYVVDMLKLINWCRVTLSELNISVSPRDLIQREMLSQIKMCNDSIVNQYIKVYSFNPDLLDDIHYDILALCVRVDEFKNNCKKFDTKYIEDSKNEATEEVKKSAKKCVFIPPKLRYTPLPTISDNIKRDDIESSVNKLHEIYSLFEGGSIKPRSTISKPTQFNNIKKLSLIAPENDKKELSIDLLKYFLLAIEYNILLQKNIKKSDEEMVDELNDLRKLYDNLKFCGQQLCYYCRMNEFDDYHPAKPYYYYEVATSRDNYGIIDALSDDCRFYIGDIKVKLFNTITQQQQLVDKLKMEI